MFRGRKGTFLCSSYRNLRTPRPFGGLSAQQAEALRAQGLSNQQSDTGGKSAGEIIRSNALTFFNLIFVVIAVLLCLVGSYRNLTFLPVVIGNTLIGIFQELRAKHILDKMSLLHAPHAVALRDGMEQKLAANDLVRGDIVVLSAGDQIPADATVLQGSVQVNEALLTGESDEIEKNPEASSCPAASLWQDGAMRGSTRSGTNRTSRSSRARPRPSRPGSSRK